ncbi:MAG: hypothetical protein DWQ06_11445 [Calditrichaeota bacterium]|nr:MAG: hypothetical protein DWQ06_11445 [Calditrichota bacterium]
MKKGELILLSVTLLICLVFAEIILRIAMPEPQNYMLRHPNINLVFTPKTEIMPGIYGDSKFSTNSLGLRGGEIEENHNYKILATGGSTAEDLYLDQEESWIRIAERETSAQSSKYNLWIGNAGKSGQNSRDHYIQLKYLLPQLPEIDAVMILVGMNDFMLRLRRDKIYDPNFMQKEDAEEILIPRVFHILPEKEDPTVPFVKRLALWKFMRKIKYLFVEPEHSQDQVLGLIGEAYQKWRENRQSASTILDTLPEMSGGLREYKQNLNLIIDLCKQHNKRVILLTQPSIWREDLEPEIEKLLWLGGIGDYQGKKGQKYYSPKALAEGMELYNQTLLDVCKERDVECIDVANEIPKDTTAFFDDCHFNEGGGKKVGKVVTNYLLQNLP